jgi:hypothetical protein
LLYVSEIQKVENEENLPIEPEHSDLHDQANKLVDFLSRHLVCLGINYAAPDSQGRDVGGIRFLYLISASTRTAFDCVGPAMSLN